MRACLTLVSLPLALLAGCSTLVGPPPATNIQTTSRCVSATIVAESQPNQSARGAAPGGGPGGAVNASPRPAILTSDPSSQTGWISDAALAETISCSLDELAARDALYQAFAADIARDRRHIGAGMLATAFTGVAFELFDAHPDNSAAAALGLGGLTVLNNGLNQTEILAVVEDSRQAFECYLVPAIQIRRALEADTRTALGRNRGLLLDQIAQSEQLLDGASGDATAALRAEMRATLDDAGLLATQSGNAYAALTHFADDMMLSWRAADATTQRRLRSLGPDYASMISAMQALQQSQAGTVPDEGTPDSGARGEEAPTTDQLEEALTGLRDEMRNVRNLLEFDYAAQRTRLAVCQAEAAG